MNSTDLGKANSPKAYIPNHGDTRDMLPVGQIGVLTRGANGHLYAHAEDLRELRAILRAFGWSISPVLSGGWSRPRRGGIGHDVTGIFPSGSDDRALGYWAALVD